MNTADDLLRRALESFDWMDIDNLLTDEIRAYLDAPKDEPVAWVQDSDYEQSPEFAFSWVETKLHDVPLYLHPPTKTAPMKPMTREEILAGLEGWDWHPDRDAGFYAGIRFAERHHGIGERDE